jgi:hypothetical protein
MQSPALAPQHEPGSIAVSTTAVAASHGSGRGSARARVLRCVASLLVAMLLAGFIAQAAFAQVAGRFLTAVGDVKLLGKDDKPRAVERGTDLLEGDRIVTGPGGLAQLRLKDGGLISVRPDTQLVLDRFTFQGKDDSTASLVFSLVKGGFRSITGLIGIAHRDGYKVNTPSATIGIRGTDHEPFFIPPGVKGPADPGTYDKVNAGMTLIAGLRGGAITVGVGQAAFVPPDGAPPVILPAIPNFYKQDLTVPDATSRAPKPGGDAKSTDDSKTADDGSDKGSRRDATRKLDALSDPSGLKADRSDTLDTNDSRRSVDTLKDAVRTPTPIGSKLEATPLGIDTTKSIDTSTPIRSTTPIDTTIKTTPLTIDTVKSIVAPTTTVSPTLAPSTTLDAGALKSTPLAIDTIRTPVTTTTTPTIDTTTTIRSLSPSTIETLRSSPLLNR